MPKNSRIERDGDFWTRYIKPHILNTAVDAYFEIAKKYNLNLAQMSLKFCRNSTICYICYYWRNNYGAVEN